MMTTHQLIAAGTIAVIVSIAGCAQESSNSASDTNDTTTTADATPTTTSDGGTSTPTNPGHSSGGGTTTSGTITVSGAPLTVSMAGTMKPDAQMHVDIVQTAGPDLAVLRLWIGTASGAGSLKAKAHSHGRRAHVHVEVPATLAPDAALWFEAEDGSGARETASLPLGSSG